MPSKKAPTGTKAKKATAKKTGTKKTLAARVQELEEKEWRLERVEDRVSHLQVVITDILWGVGRILEETNTALEKGKDPYKTPAVQKCIKEVYFNWIHTNAGPYDRLPGDYME